MLYYKQESGMLFLRKTEKTDVFHLLFLHLRAQNIVRQYLFQLIPM